MVCFFHFGPVRRDVIGPLYVDRKPDLINGKEIRSEPDPRLLWRGSEFSLDGMRPILSLASRHFYVWTSEFEAENQWVWD